MHTIDQYMDAARKRQSINSDRALAGALGLKPTSTNHWRTRRAWPSDVQMVTLARLAGLDVKEALLELNIWRAKEAGVRLEYETIIDKIKTATAVVAVASFIGAASIGDAAAKARTDAEQINTKSPQLYIMGNMRYTKGRDFLVFRRNQSPRLRDLGLR